jgi:exosortase E/protease (VPEID-CTERM system)
MAKAARLVGQGSASEPSTARAATPLSSSARGISPELSWPAYATFIAVFFCAEIAAYYRFSTSTPILMHVGPEVRHWLIMLTVRFQEMMLVAAATTILLSRTEFVALAMRVWATPVAVAERRTIVALQVLMAGALVVWTGLNPGFFASPPSVAAWAVVRMALAVSALATLGFTLIPLDVWRSWYAATPGAFRGGLVVGLAAPVLQHFIPMLSSALYEFTIWAAAATLSALGQQPVLNWHRYSIAVPGFRILVAPQCAGIDGIILITLFLAAYLWFCRSSLRFPAALILFPVGVIVSWILNDVRLAALVMIGRHNPGLAIRFFHSIAGWAFLDVVAVGLVVSSLRIARFRAEPLHAVARSGEPSSSADVYLLPMLVTLAAGMLTRPFGASLDGLYPVTVIATAAVLFFYRSEIIRLGWNVDLSSLGAGAAVFAIWIALARWSGTLHDPSMAAALRSLPGWDRYGWLLFRVAGAVVTVPIAEELCFRGYLLRKLVSADFESVDPRRFTWLSFLLSSLLFGLLHRNWIAGILAGMGFALVLYRRGRLTDAIVAHSACNALLASYVLATGSWALWS